MIPDAVLVMIRSHRVMHVRRVVVRVIVELDEEQYMALLQHVKAAERATAVTTRQSVNHDWPVQESAGANVPPTSRSAIINVLS
jgi:hypothetical protein